MFGTVGLYFVLKHRLYALLSSIFQNNVSQAERFFVMNSLPGPHTSRVASFYEGKGWTTIGWHGQTCLAVLSQLQLASHFVIPAKVYALGAGIHFYDQNLLNRRMDKFLPMRFF